MRGQASSHHDLVEHRSGSSVHKKARVSKRGDSFVRKVLFETTLAVVKFNPAVREIYRRFKENGRPDKVARIPAARKLLLIGHAVYRSKRPTDPQGPQGVNIQYGI